MNITEFVSYNLRSTPILVMVVAVLLLLWRQPLLRERAFYWIGKAPKWAQPIVPMVLAGITAAGQGYLDGVRGEELLTLGASQAGQAGIYAIGIWHTAKRWWPVVVRIWRATRKTNTATLVACFAASVPLLCCGVTLEESRAQAAVAYVGPIDVRYVGGKPVATGVVARASQRCESLSDKESYAGGTAVFMTIASGASGVATWPAKSDSVEQGLAWGAGAALIIAGTAQYFESRYKSQWATECSH